MVEECITIFVVAVDKVKKELVVAGCMDAWGRTAKEQLGTEKGTVGRHRVTCGYVGVEMGPKDFEKNFLRGIFQY